ncbi:MAG: bifunctional DNA-formamidopyrimidine glycosylase/DNA-(apurinic or apyrimidinic site) lyase [Kiritimatiellae bacterium]|nr:bifunctional DNA-formamidopyrimidine glycosylase/DNA-(apurinic or apyrimidinic site) lyase [Kiritimatiellia bacterium]
MPELPEVETIVRELRCAEIIGRKITDCVVFWPPLIKGRPFFFRKRLVGRKITAINRRGKFIVFNLSGGLFLLVHLRMSGQFCLVRAGRGREKHQHIILRLSGGRELRYCDARKFGRWEIAADTVRVLGKLGPEPLGKSFRPADLFSRLHSHRRQLKPLLLDQGFLAGVGNIYADEALWEGRLHPRRLSDSLTEREAFFLFKAIRSVLRRAIRNKGTSLGTGAGNYHRPGRKQGRNQGQLNIPRRRGALCPRCGGAVSRLLVGQRASYHCPRCQRL